MILDITDPNWSLILYSLEEYFLFSTEEIKYFVFEQPCNYGLDHLELHIITNNEKYPDFSLDIPEEMVMNQWYSEWKEYYKKAGKLYRDFLNESHQKMLENNINLSRQALTLDDSCAILPLEYKNEI